MQTTCSHRTTLSWLQSDPQLAQAILGDNINELQNILRSRHLQKMELKRKQEEELVRISLLIFLHCLNYKSYITCKFYFQLFHMEDYWITLCLWRKYLLLLPIYLLENLASSIRFICFITLRLVFFYVHSCLCCLANLLMIVGQVINTFSFCRLYCMLILLMSKLRRKLKLQFGR